MKMTGNLIKGAGAAVFLLIGATMHPVAADAIYNRCIDQSDGTNFAWAECGGEWVKREDEKLNATWKKVFAQVEGQSRTDLLAEQRLWIAYKDSACTFYANGDWGREGQVLHYAACRAGIIATRTRELEAYGDFFGGK